MTTSYTGADVAAHARAGDAWVIVDGRVFDVTPFLESHPGGEAVLEPYLGSDASHVMRAQDFHRHSDSAFDLLEQYCVGTLADCKESSSSPSPGHSREWKEEELVDWSKALLGQVGAVGRHYQEWVHTPVNQPLRLFSSDLLEGFTKSPWWLVPLVWIPFALYMSWHTIAGTPSVFPAITTSDPMAPILFAALLPFGFLIWTFIEYSLHRFVFHLQPPHDAPYWITFHFLIHGQHHKVPFDRLRLVFPPVPASVIMLMLYVPVAHFIPLCLARALFIGGLLGYITYDLTHYYVHHGSPEVGSYLASLKTYHIAHHYLNYNLGFGISTKLWDYPFNTLLRAAGNHSSSGDKRQ